MAAAAAPMAGGDLQNTAKAHNHQAWHVDGVGKEVDGYYEFAGLAASDGWLAGKPVFRKEAAPQSFLFFADKERSWCIGPEQAQGSTCVRGVGAKLEQITEWQWREGGHWQVDDCIAVVPAEELRSFFARLREDKKLNAELAMLERLSSGPHSLGALCRMSPEELKRVLKKAGVSKPEKLQVLLSDALAHEREKRVPMDDLLGSLTSQKQGQAAQTQRRGARTAKVANDDDDDVDADGYIHPRGETLKVDLPPSQSPSPGDSQSLAPAAQTCGSGFGRARRRRPEATFTQLKPSEMPGSAKYSFGKRPHETGNFKKEVLNPRHLHYRPDPCGTPSPGVGTYRLTHSNGDDLPETHGHSGGWFWKDHAVFMRTLNELEKESKRSKEPFSWPNFFDALVGRSPHLQRKAIADHLRWVADQELEEAKKHRRVSKWVTESKFGTEVQDDRREQVMERRRHRELHYQAELEESRWDLRETAVRFNAHQTSPDGQVLEKNMRGHPEYRKAAVFTFGCSREIRDATVKRHTDLSNVRSSSALDAPGPGSYPGHAETAPALTMKRSSSWSFSGRHAEVKTDRNLHAGPGYSGPGCSMYKPDAFEKRESDLRLTQQERPSWSFGHEAQRSEHLSNERKALRDSTGATERVGPSTYNHVTSFVSHY